jgi:histone H2B
MKQEHHDLQISRKATQAVESLVDMVMKRLVGKGIVLAEASKKGTISCRHMQAATQLTLPKDIGKHAVSEAAKAVVKFTCLTPA